MSKQHCPAPLGSREDDRASSSWYKNVKDQKDRASRNEVYIAMNPQKLRRVMMKKNGAYISELGYLTSCVQGVRGRSKRRMQKMYQNQAADSRCPKERQHDHQYRIR